eukprot:4562055-Amphidinium_carterae.1
MVTELLATTKAQGKRGNNLIGPNTQTRPTMNANAMTKARFPYIFCSPLDSFCPRRRSASLRHLLAWHGLGLIVRCVSHRFVEKISHANPSLALIQDFISNTDPVDSVEVDSSQTG